MDFYKIFMLVRAIQNISEYFGLMVKCWYKDIYIKIRGFTSSKFLNLPIIGVNDLFAKNIYLSILLEISEENEVCNSKVLHRPKVGKNMVFCAVTLQKLDMP